MAEMKIPKFENEADEANWLHANREQLGAAFLQAVQEGRKREGTQKRRAQVESVLLDALRSKELVMAPQELNGRSLVSVLRGMLTTK